MKIILPIMFVISAALVASAQTNSIIFPQLLSPTNSVLMTNAEFHSIIGNRIFFGSGSDIRSFHAGDLNTNVLAALHVTPEQLAEKQLAMDAAEQKRKAQLAARQAEQERQRQLAIQDQAIIEAGYQKQLKQQQESHGNSYYYTTPRESVGIGAP
jgi:hypothetical protein